MNLNYAKAVKIDLKGLLSAGFIAPVNQATWLSPITVVPKKNGIFLISVNFSQLNTATRKDPYLLLFTGEVLDTLIGQDAYSFVDCFSRYHQERIH